MDLPVEARAAAAHVFVESVEAPVLAGEDHHHLLRVLRLAPGDAVSVADGAGGWVLCRLDGERLVAEGPAVTVAAPDPEITVGFAVPKGDRADWAVQKLTEVGVDGIVALDTDRGVVRWREERADRQLARWRAIARHAAMQCRRPRIPTVSGPWRLADLAAAGIAAGAAARGTAGGGPIRPPVARAEPGGPPPSLRYTSVLVGPEGGWSEAERAVDAGEVGLGPTVLRTETAAVVAGALLVALRSGVTRPAR